MSFMKLDDCKSIAEVIERNTSVKAEEFVLLSEKEPFIKNLKETVELILNNKGKLFHIVGDFDTDGVCATSIMEAGLRRVVAMAALLSWFAGIVLSTLKEKDRQEFEFRLQVIDQMEKARENNE